MQTPVSSGHQDTSSGPDIEGLSVFIRQRDRDKARFFVGRRTQIDHIDHTWQDVQAQVRAGAAVPASSASILIQGAPGAGKTSLLNHMQTAWEADDTAPRALHIQRRNLDDDGTIATRIAYALDTRAGDELRRTYSVTGGGRAGFAGLNLSGGATRTTAAPEISFDTLARVIEPSLWQRPVVLLIDEIQNATADHDLTLSLLHEGRHGLPIIPLFAGLANSRDVLVRRGISRFGLDDIHTIGGLEPGEPGEAVRMMLEGFRIDLAGADVARWAARLEEISDGWPQHLDGSLHALAEGLVKTEGHLARVDEAAVLTRAQERRLIAYRARRSPEMRQSRALLGTVMASLPEDGVEMDMLLDVIEQTLADTDDRIGWQLPDGMTARHYLDHLIHRGALQINADDLFICPIPSFRQFLIEQGEPEGAVSPAPAGLDC